MIAYVPYEIKSEDSEHLVLSVDGRRDFRGSGEYSASRSPVHRVPRRMEESARKSQPISLADDLPSEDAAEDPASGS